LSNTAFSIGSGQYRVRGNILTLKQIEGGNLEKALTGSYNEPGWRFSSDELEISGLSIINKVPSRLGMNKLSLSDATILVSTEEKERTRTNIEFEIESYRRLGRMMTRLSIDTTLLKEVRISYKTFSDTSSHTFLADSIGLTIHNIDVDTSFFSNADKDVVNRMSIDLKGRTRITEDSLYIIRSGLINYDFRNDIIRIDSFEVIPRYKGEEFFRKAVYQTDRMHLFSRMIEAHDFRLEELLEDDHIHFGRIDINGMQLEMMRDKTYDRKPNDFKPMPQEMLRNARQKFTIDSIRVIHSFMRYGEYVEKSSVPGVVYFDDFNLNMYNLTSNLPCADPTTSLKVDLNAMVMGEARIDLDIVFPLLGNSTNFWMEASSERFDLTKLSPLTEVVLGLTITEGIGGINKSFVTGNSEHTRGTLMFTYNKLKLSLYNRKKAEKNKGMFAGITRFLINDLLIHRNNPKFNRDIRIGQVYFERDKEKAILNYVWKSLLSGMLSSIGINTKEQRQERRDMKNISSPSQ
jgi:hypothetical protein